MYNLAGLIQYVCTYSTYVNIYTFILSLAILNVICSASSTFMAKPRSLQLTAGSVSSSNCVPHHDRNLTQCTGTKQDQNQFGGKFDAQQINSEHPCNEDCSHPRRSSPCSPKTDTFWGLFSSIYSEKQKEIKI